MTSSALSRACHPEFVAAEADGLMFLSTGHPGAQWLKRVAQCAGVPETAA